MNRSLSQPEPRNLSLLRLEEADRRVGRRLAVVRGRLDAAGVASGLAEGSAIAAEIALPEANLRRRAIRANLTVAAADLDTARSTLKRLGYRDLGPNGGVATVELLKEAGRTRRSAVHVVFDDELTPGGTSLPAADRPHPGSPEAMLDRRRRLARYRMAPATVMTRLRSRETWIGRREETVEIGLLIES
ncbi:MAG: hypothetical protein ACYTFH_02990 [Planctomycetota bacterium]|jgi:hypothetical protein